MDRRQVLAGVLASSCLTFVRRVSARNQIRAEIEDSAGLIGDWYLQHFPEERDRTFLQNRLARAVPGFIPDQFGAEASIDRIQVQRACTADFHHNDVISVGGWVLTRTELRLCALVALSRASNDH